MSCIQERKKKEIRTRMIVDREAQVNANVRQKKKIFIFTFIPPEHCSCSSGEISRRIRNARLAYFRLLSRARISIVRQTEFYFLEQLHIHAYFFAIAF
ncbi:hypothetical protein CEXT_505901 [Caerostris extrusa]|uniref:Ribosomal protein S14 n=1 Tax=Caerostris extrusa TaxID=172846 RepID=A0AAV4YFI6_CAEEX|nr:hypothetical protein CEXT_505901 [Caerostris extrusa]